ncbi:MAG: hypothetical protein D6760_12495 [Deltaproteobacteria bacterium]|nr:MAG: hypothetical protein D6760_12495 [Deltaproteobacteria bacterium]
MGRSALGLTALAAGLSAAAGWGRWESVVAGGAFMTADFHLIRLLVSRLMAPERSRTAALALLTAKVVLVLLLLAGLFVRLPIEPLSFALGATLLPVAAVLDAVWLGDPVGGGLTEN